ncbi:Wall-associated receptor kinase-like 10 [Hordeum vulgare]|nr:Wall-associated receptor kinase-like 10 [Hordeum vulgare]
MLLAATAESLLTVRPDCQQSCGGVDIPYPFGIGAGCFLRGFEITCLNNNTMPVLPASTGVVRVLSLLVMPRPEARVMLPAGVVDVLQPRRQRHGSYTFRAADLHMEKKTSMPLRLDWAVRDSNVNSTASLSCAQLSLQGNSDHSECVDSMNGPGYVCNCTKGYEGNPYLPHKIDGVRFL